MNIEKYASHYTRFHGAFSHDIVHKDVIVLPFTTLTWIKSMILRIFTSGRIQHYDHNTPAKPLMKAFQLFFKSEDLCTYFASTNESFSLLIGNKVVLFPMGNAKYKLCATPYFIKNAQFVESMGAVASVHENIYTFKNNVLFLDKYDVPFFGGQYFEDTQPPLDDYYRICFITEEDPASICYDEWAKRREVLVDPFKTRPTDVNICKFIQLHPVADMSFPDYRLESTSLVKKTLTTYYPHFVLQDILNTYHGNGGSLDNLGIFIEYPLQITYDGSKLDRKRSEFLAIAFNGDEPQKVLYVRQPYDRYFEYKYCPSVIWTHIFFRKPILNVGLSSKVILHSTVLGYCYKNAFFCFTYPMLTNKPIPTNLNTECILDPVVDFILDEDELVDVIDTYHYNAHYSIHRVKHKTFFNEMWCISRNEGTSKYRKRSLPCSPSTLVHQWISFWEENKDYKDVDFGDLSIPTLVMILARHKMCFDMKVADEPKDRDLIFESDRDIIFKLDQEVVDFVNQIRLTVHKYDENKQKSASQCNIL